MRMLAGPLLRNRDFRRLWAGETVSLIGAEVATLALPLTAVIVLDATPLQVALLSAATWSPYLLVSLFAGVLVDRRRRRPLLVGANLARAGLLSVIPLAAVSRTLSIEMLYLIAFAMGVFTVIFNLAYRSYLPAVVGREHLIEGNSKLQASASLAEVGGPSLGGVLVQAVTAPLTLLVTALTFIISAVNLAFIRQSEPAPVHQSCSSGVWREISSGLRLTVRNSYLRAFAGAATTYNFFEQVVLSLFVVYAVRELAITPAQLGIIMGIGSVGALIGAFVAEPIGERIRLGYAIIGATILECAAFLLIPAASGPHLLNVCLLTLAFLIVGFGGAVDNVYWSSLRQAVTPNHVLGRVLASYSFFSLGVVPLGALFGGLLQAIIGIRATLLVGALGSLLSVVWLLDRDVRTLVRLPSETMIGHLDDRSN